MQRRAFLKTIAAAGASTIILPDYLSAYRGISAAKYFSLHPFIDTHPEAVFIMRTSVSSKTAATEKMQAGLDLANQIFSLSDSAGIPLSNLMAIKPNLTCTGGAADTIDGMGIRTDVPFLEGLINGIISTGFLPSNMYMRESNWMGDAYCPSERLIGGMKEMAERTGVHLLDFPTGRTVDQLAFDTLVDDQEVIWKDCTGGVVFKRVGYLAPFNRTDSWILNVSKFKTHGMGMTLCVKNLQGTAVNPLVSFCESVDHNKLQPANVRDYFQPDLETHIDSLYDAHRTAGYPRWDRDGRDSSGGYGMETWAQRTCDSHSLMNPGLHIIEGIYGRNGNGFADGPGANGKAEDFLTNILIFGKDPFLVDIIGFWLAGHEPGNFGLFHIAKERGMLSGLNPMKIPVYEWSNGSPTLTPLDHFTRTPLVCTYLRRDYNGQTEPLYHLVNEPFHYDPTNADDAIEKPDAYILNQNYSNPFHDSTIIEYTLPKSCYAQIEVFDAKGERIDLLVHGWQTQGVHMTKWDAGRRAAGVYYYRFRANGFVDMKKMIVVR